MLNNDQAQLIIQARNNLKQVMKELRPGPGMNSVAAEDRVFYEELDLAQNELKDIINLNSYNRSMRGAK